MDKDYKDKDCDWVIENYGVTFKFKQENTHESTMHVRTENAWKRTKK